MTRIITVASQKGGVGKTTTTLNLGFSLGRLGNRVLLVDTDPQGSIGLATNLRKRTQHGMVQVIRGELSLEKVISITKDRTMGVLGTGALEPDDAILLEDAARDGRLKAVIAECATAFDYVIVDAPAGVGSQVSALLEASDGVILVLRAQALALKSLPTLLRLIHHVRETRNAKLLLEGILFTVRHHELPEENKSCEEFLQGLPAPFFFETQIPYDPRFEEASGKCIPLALLKGGEDLSRIFLDLAVEFRAREARRISPQGGQDESTDGLF
jgi:chromosome partitioning protein